jgi:hypothetical protein
MKAIGLKPSNVRRKGLKEAQALAKKHEVPPPQHIIDAHANPENIADYDKCVADIIKSSTPYSLFLQSLHSKIHPGYYDVTSEDGTYMVKDFRGHFVPKLDCVLTTDGRYYQHSSSMLTSASSSEGSQRIAQQVRNPTCRKHIVGFHLNPDSYMAVPIADCFQDFTTVIRISDFLKGINTWFSGFLSEEERASLSYSDSPVNLLNNVLITPDVRIESLLKTTLEEDAYKTIPSGFGEFSGLKLKVNDGSTLSNYLNTNNGCVVLLRADSSYRVGGSVSGFSVGDERVAIPYTTNHPFFDALNIKFAREVVVAPGMSIKDPLLTPNNHGELCGYTTRITGYKPCFLSLEGEKVDDYTPYLGIELEMNVSEEDRMSDIVELIANTPFGDYCIFKRDGSLDCDVGLELVTVPATLNYHKKMFNDYFFDDVHNFQRFFDIDESCGMHVHISKKSFITNPKNTVKKFRTNKNVSGSIPLGMFISFINGSYNSSFIDAIAGRSAGEYRQRTRLTGNSEDGIKTSAKIAKTVKLTGPSLQRGNSHGLGRGAVNLNPAYTTEVRIFASTTEKVDLFARIDFCVALLKYCKEGSIQAVGYGQFVDWVVGEVGFRREFKDLVNWLGVKGYAERIRKENKLTGKVNYIITKKTTLKGN